MKKKGERLDALDVALENEMKEREFYLTNAKRTSNPLGKEMFQQIADDELEHYERLKELHVQWEKEEQWPETLPLKVRGTTVRNVLDRVIKGRESMPPGDEDDLKALRVAIEFEAKGVEFYARLRDLVSDPREKKFFELLSGIEQEHYTSLKETEELLTDPESWYRLKERHIFDGG